MYMLLESIEIGGAEVGRTNDDSMLFYNIFVRVATLGFIIWLLVEHASKYRVSPSEDQILILGLLFSLPVCAALIVLHIFQRGKGRVAAIQGLVGLCFYMIAFFVRFFLNEAMSPQYVGNGEGGVVSVYESYFILLLISCGMAIVVVACGDWNRFAVLWKVSAGVSVVIGILLPGMLESHKFLWAEWNSVGQSAESSEGVRLSISLIEFAIEFSVAYVVMYVIFSMILSISAAQMDKAILLKDEYLIADPKSCVAGEDEVEVADSMESRAGLQSYVVDKGAVGGGGMLKGPVSCVGAQRPTRSRFRVRDLFLLGLLLVCGR